MKILVGTTSFGKYDPSVLAALAQAGLDPIFNPEKRTLTTDELARHAAGCPGIIAGLERYDREALSRLPDLQVISRCGAGLDGIDFEAAAEMGVIVESTPCAPTEAVAELTVGFVLDLVRGIGRASAQMRRGVWRKEMGLLLRETTIGLIGLGRIGRRVVELLAPFEARVIGYDPEPQPEWAAANPSVSVPLDRVLGESDVVSLHVPFTPELRHLISRNAIEKMKQGACLINASRGGLVDESALHAALVAGRLGGAALDVYEREPYDGPLRGLENVVLTPHIGSWARAARIRMEREAAENLIAGLRRAGRLA